MGNSKEPPVVALPFPIPYSLFPIPYSLFPIPYSLQLKHLRPHLRQQHQQQGGEGAEQQREQEPQQPAAVLALRQRRVDQGQRAPTGKPWGAIGPQRKMIHDTLPSDGWRRPAPEQAS